MTRLRHAALAAAILLSSLSVTRPAVAQTAGPIVSLEWLHAHAGDASVVVIATGDRDEFEAARAAGLPALVYQGSWHDWSMHADYPTTKPAGASDRRRL
jgi:3-mercaptopyruvate sulfurtransferase SseA